GCHWSELTTLAPIERAIAPIIQNRHGGTGCLPLSHSSIRKPSLPIRSMCFQSVRPSLRPGQSRRFVEAGRGGCTSGTGATHQPPSACLTRYFCPFSVPLMNRRPFSSAVTKVVMWEASHQSLARSRLREPAVKTCLQRLAQALALPHGNRIV